MKQFRETGSRQQLQQRQLQMQSNRQYKIEQRYKQQRPRVTYYKFEEEYKKHFVNSNYKWQQYRQQFPRREQIQRQQHYHNQHGYDHRRKNQQRHTRQLHQKNNRFQEQQRYREHYRSYQYQQKYQHYQRQFTHQCVEQKRNSEYFEINFFKE